MKEKIYDVIVIGAGPAGVSAACYAKRKGLNTLLISKNLGGQLLCTSRIFSNISAGPGINTIDLIKKYKSSIEYEDVKFVKGEVLSIERVNNDGMLLIKMLNIKFKSRAVIVATGRVPGEISLPINKAGNYKKLGIYSFIDYPYYKAKNDKNILILGGGYVGLDVAEEFSEHCQKIFIVEKTNKLGGNKRRQDEVLLKKNIEIFMESSLLLVREEDGNFFATIKTPLEEIEIEINSIYVSVGTKPETKFLDIKKSKHGEIITKLTRDRTKMGMTSVDGVFACGDCVETTEYGFEPLAIGEGIRCAKTVCNYLSH